MQNNIIQVFESNEFGKLEVLMIGGKPYFPAKEVAETLGYAKSRNAIERHCPHALKRGVGVQTGVKADGTPSFQTVEKTFISEGDLYRLIIRSKLPAAVRFEAFICDVVIPTIRQTGGYIGNDELFINTYLPFADEGTKSMFAATLQTIRDQNKHIEGMKPKAEFFDTVATSKDAIDIGSTAKVLNMKIGRNRLFELLRNEGILMSNNQPYQTYIDRGYFRTIEQKYTRPDGSTHIYIKTMVFQRGLNFIRQIVAKGQTVGLKT